MKRLLFATAFIAGFAGSWVAIRHVVPTEQVRAEIERALSEAAGEPLRLTGRAEAGVFPSLAIRFQDATVQRVDGQRVEGQQSDGARPLASMASLKVSVALSSLLLGRVEVTTVQLERPTLAVAAGLDAAALAPTRAALARLQPLTLVVDDGTVALTDPVSGRTETVEKIDGTFAWQRLAGNASLDARLRWRGEDVALTAQGLGPRGLVDGRSGPTVLTLAAAPLTLSFNGKGVLTETMQFDGGFSASVADAARLARWLGWDAGQARALRDIAVEGRLRAVGLAATLADARISVDGNRAEGVISARADLPRPQVRATLAFDTLDIAPYQAAMADLSRDLVVDQSLLGRLDLDLRASAQSVSTGLGPLSGVGATLLMKNGRFDAELGEMHAFGGDGTLLVRGTSDADGLDVSARFGMTDMTADAVGPAFGVSALQKGRLSLTADARAQGRTLGALIRGFNGRARVDVRDLAVAGAEPLSTFTQFRTVAMRLPSTGRVSSFDRATVDLAFDRSKARIDRLQADGAAMALKLAGSADFATGWLDLVGTVAPRARATAALAGAVVAEVPLRIAGSITSPEALPIQPTSELPKSELGTNSVPVGVALPAVAMPEAPAMGAALPIPR
jgi:AsmA protein